jgi:TorA maturation chaperone TorD
MSKVRTLTAALWTAGTLSGWALGAALVASPAVPVEAAQSQWGGSRVDRMIERAFSDVLRRSPDDRELRRYRLRVEEDHWNEDDIRADLRARQDYRSHTERTERDRGSYDVDRMIRAAYQDILGRDPDPQGLRDYRRRVVEDGWTERQVRDALRKSQEHAENPTAAADRTIRRAYQDILGRAPDASGLASYRNQIVYHGWDEHDVREALMRSPEYREKNTMTPDKAREIVRRAYLSVLGREPDPASEGWVQKVLREHWTEREVARELRNSDEYRSRQ